MSRPSGSPIDAEIIRLHRLGLNQKAVSAAVGITQSGVSRAYRRLGLQNFTHTPAYDLYQPLHEGGLSTAKIAKQFGAKKNSVLKCLRYHGTLRLAPGRAVELEVAAWTAKFARSCYRMPGDHPYDLLVDGERIDVKSARWSRNAYYFELVHKNTAKDYHQHVDEFYLVLTDTPRRQVYRLNAADVSVKRCLTIPKDPTKSKYPLQFLGHLESEVIA